MVEKVDLVATRRQEIVGAALKVVARKGYQNAGIADIAAELQIGHGTIYRYFENKRDIAGVVIDEVISRVALVVQAVPAEEIETLEQYRERLLLIGDGLVASLDQDPTLARWISFETLGLPEEITGKIDAAFDLFAHYTEAYLKNGIEKGFLRQDIRTWETALALNAMLFEAAKRLSRVPGSRQNAKQVWFDTVIGLMLDGLAARP
jgi:AcrR family transcriptional regulator